MEAFKKKEVEKFIQKSVAFLQENFKSWCKKKEQKDLEQFVHQTVDFAKQKNICKKNNIQKLMFLSIQFHLEFPLSDNLNKFLLPIETNEDARLKDLYKYLDQSARK